MILPSGFSYTAECRDCENRAFLDPVEHFKETGHSDFNLTITKKYVPPATAKKGIKGEEQFAIWAK